ncbi:ECF transporter S component [Candidatus Thorarchaeota archaeon]|nr:MAG: ECF transporter S component [Candidatus Thorarchaeota archaeon]
MQYSAASRTDGKIGLWTVEMTTGGTLKAPEERHTHSRLYIGSNLYISSGWFSVSLTDGGRSKVENWNPTRMDPTIYKVLVSIFTALTAAVTMIINVPFPTSTGYLNFGDSMVMISGLLLGPVGGLIAGGAGSAMADVALGYLHFAPITLVVKGAEGLLVGLLSARSREISIITAWDILGIILGALAMLVGYYSFELVLYGATVALEELLFVNWIQVTVGGIIAVVVGPMVREILRDLIGRGPDQSVWLEDASEQSVVHLRRT